MKSDESRESLTVIWGAKNIGAAIGLNERQAFHLLATGQLPARKVGNSWVAEFSALRRFFLPEAACGE